MKKTATVALPRKPGWHARPVTDRTDEQTDPNAGRIFMKENS